VEDIRGAMCEEVGALAEQCPQRPAVRLRPTRGRQQPVAGQRLDTLTVQDGTLTARHALDGLGHCSGSTGAHARRVPQTAAATRCPWMPSPPSRCRGR
jgi:hypothetical protein